MPGPDWRGTKKRKFVAHTVVRISIGPSCGNEFDSQLPILKLYVKNTLVYSPIGGFSWRLCKTKAKVSISHSIN
jgi:hypothetical protein